MNIFCRLIVLVWGLFSVNVFAFTYYVDGNIASSGIGTSVGTAFKTIQEAAIVAIAGDTCLIKSGVYRETIIPSNSGTPGNPIVFMPFNGSETVTISGADTLSGWTIYQSAIYQAPQAWTMGRGLDQVFMDGKVVIAARHPNSTTTSDGDYVLPLHLDLSPLWPKFGPFKVNKDTIRSITNNVDLNQSAPDYWKGGIYLGYNWWSWAMQSADIASSQPGKISIAMGTRRWWFAGNSYNAGSTVQFGYITNHLNALDTSGEWHWQNNTLYLWSPDNGTPAHHRVEAKKRYLAFDLRGRDNITLKGLRIFAASVNIFNSNNCIIDGCTLEYISHFMKWDDSRDGYIDDYSVKNSNGAPMEGRVGVVIGGTSNTVRNSIIRYSSGAGLYLCGYKTTVTNNYIHDCGYTSTYLGPVFIAWDPTKDLATTVRGGHTITYNELYNAGRECLSFSCDDKKLKWSGSLLDTAASIITNFEACDIGYNRMHDACLVANDGGLFNSWFLNMGTNGSSTQLHHNLIWDQYGLFWDGLVYPDGGSDKLDVHDNVMWYSDKCLLYEKYAPGSVKTGIYPKPATSIQRNTNQPNGTKFFNNTSKSGYSGGVNGLGAIDYPGGIFWRTGPDFLEYGEVIAPSDYSAWREGQLACNYCFIDLDPRRTNILHN